MEYEELVDGTSLQGEIEEETESQISFFDLVKDISEHGKYIETFFEEHKVMPPQWNTYMMHRVFSEHKDCILLINELNKYWWLPDEIQWRFLKNTIYKKKRFGFTKKIYNDMEKPIEILAKYFKCTVKEMQKNIHAIPREKLYEILEEFEPELGKKYKKNLKK